LALALGCVAGLAQAAPLETYGRLPNIEEVAVSPSGAYVALVATDGEARSVIVKSTADGKLRALSQAGKVKVRGLTWAGDDHLIVATTSTQLGFELEGPQVERTVPVDLDLNAHKTRGLMEGTGQGVMAMNTIHGAPKVRTVDGQSVVFARGTYFEGGGRGKVGLFKVDLAHGHSSLIQHGTSDAYDWLVDGAGQVVAEASYSDKAGIWTLRIKTPASGWQKVERAMSPVDTPDLVGMTSDGRSIIVEESDGANGRTWRKVSIETGQWTDANDEAIGEKPLVSAADGRVIGAFSLVGDEPRYTFYDPKDTAIWRGIQRAYPDDFVTLVSWSTDHRTVVARVDSALYGPAFALVDIAAGSADWLGPEFVGLKPSDVARKTSIRYAAADGTEISGYLTLPTGRQPKGLPLVVLAHGGPAARDKPGFDWEAQALASRGYAVLQPNFRGSSGLGDAFRAAGYGQWGRKMQTDLSDGARYLEKLGVVDAKRVCIAGGSYGGYAALAGATIDHGVYRCAVDYAGVSDLRAQVTSSKIRYGEGAARYWRRFIGARDDSDPVMATYSPVNRAAEADIPILLIHGRDDSVVPFAQSQKMAEALRRAGKPVEFVALPGEDHWLSRGETRLKMLQAEVAFLEKNNPPN